MSLLPGRILPPTEPLGTVGDDGKTITINKNWYLLLWNLSAQTLGTGAPGAPGTPGTPGSPGLPAPSLYVADVDLDVAESDIAVLRQQISNLRVGDIELAPVIDTTALLLAQDALLPDPIPQAQPVAAIVVTASPFTYTAAFNGEVVITGTVTSVAIIRQGTSVSTGLLVGIFPIRWGDQLVVTYPAAAPTMTFLPN